MNEQTETLLRLLHPVFRDCIHHGTPLSARYDLSSPWVHDGFVYATDGQIIARCPATPEMVAAQVRAASGRGRVRDPERAMGLHTDFRGDDVPAPEPKTLPVCPSCHGTGEQQAYECSECGHEGKAGTCHACDGRGADGYEKIENAVTVGEATIRWDFAATLFRHGAVLRPNRADPKKGAVRWHIPGAGVEGAVMPLI